LNVMMLRGTYLGLREVIIESYDLGLREVIIESYDVMWNVSWSKGGNY